MTETATKIRAAQLTRQLMGRMTIKPALVKVADPPTFLCVWSRSRSTGPLDFRSEKQQSACGRDDSPDTIGRFSEEEANF
jgi:hypothetical protein